MTQDRLKAGAAAVVSGSEWGDTLGSVKLAGKRPRSTEPGEPQNRTEV